MKVTTVAILSAATATGAGSTFEPNGNGDRTFQLTGITSAGAGATAVDIEVSNDGANFVSIGRLSLILGTSVTQALMITKAPWRYVRANVISISGTNAVVTLTMGNHPY